MRVIADIDKLNPDNLRNVVAEIMVLKQKLGPFYDLSVRVAESDIRGTFPDAYLDGRIKYKALYGFPLEIKQ